MFVRARLLLALFFSLLPLTTPPAAAQPASPAADAACPEGNLLSGKRPMRWEDTENAVRASDGTAPEEGEAWDTTSAAKLVTAASQIVWDLGREVSIRALALQGDNNDTYTVGASLDGKTWTPAWVAPAVEGAGMRLRAADGLDVRARYLRVADMTGDGAYSLGEVQAWCAKPATWPPEIARKKGVVPDPGKDRLVVMAYRKILFGIAGFAVFCFLLADGRRTKWTLYGPPAAAALLWLYGAANLLNTWGVVGAAVAVVGAAVWLSSLAKTGQDWVGKADAIGLVAVGLLIGYAGDRYGEGKTQLAVLHSLAIGGAGLLAMVLALRNAGKTWTAWAPPAIALAYGTFAGWLSFGADTGIAVGVVGAVAALGAQLLTKDAAARRKWLERLALLLLVGCGPLVWTNMGTFHGGRAVHFHDSYHYYMGSKYFPETRYTLMYHCAAIAEADEGLGEKVAKRKIRNLTTNHLEPMKDTLADVESCKQAFTPERWVAFQQDVRLFRSFFGVSYWEKLFHDHGYNASPVWNAFGRAIANHGWEKWAAGIPVGGPGENTEARRAWIKANTKDFAAQARAFNERMGHIALIDAGLYAGIFLLIGWAFGLRAMALACVVWGAGYPWAYFWTGGAFGRVLWLFLATAGVCLLKKAKPLLGGMGLMGGLLDRVFPGALFAGVGMKVAWGLYKERRISKTHQRFILGALLAAAIAVPLSLPAAGASGIGAYPEFIENSMKHKQTPLTNHMGLPTLFSWHPSYIASKVKNDKLEDPFEPWKERRRQTLKSRGVFFYGTVLGLLLLVGAAARRMEDWEASAASVLMIIAVFELTCYYYNFMLLLAPLALRRLRHVVALAGMTIAGQYVQLRIGWYDQQYTVESLVALGAVLFIVVDRLLEARREEAAAAAVAPAEAVN
jgi:hypothetical protein